MNVLDYLNQKKNTLVPSKHPMENQSQSFKYHYCFGLAVLVYGYKEQLPGTIEYFSTILNSIQLDLETQSKLPVQVKHNFDLKINDVFKELTKKEEQYCFITDLYRLSHFCLISPTYSNDIIDGYMKIFNLSNSEKVFLKEFSSLGNQLLDEYNKNNTASYLDNKSESATSLYKHFTSLGYHISASILKYMYPNFKIVTEIDNLILNDGREHRISSYTHIKGSVTVTNASSLVFENGNINIDGNIIIDNGKFSIKQSDIYISNTQTDYAVNVINSPYISIEDSRIYCKEKSAFLKQNCGHLKIQKTTICDTWKDYAITFSGNSIDIGTSSFKNCKNGAIRNLAKDEFFIASSTFTSCYNVHGGAIYSDSIANSTIYNCNFKECHAQYIGGAVYFVNLRYGQVVLHSTYENCTPEDSILFNVYQHDSEIT